MTTSGHEATPGPAPEAEDTASLLADLPWLFKHYWMDAINLMAAEGRVALRSLVLIVALIFCLAGLIAGAWLVLMLFLIYGAAAAGAPVWAIAIGAFLLHVLVFAGVAQQMLALARLLSFPRTRHAAGELLVRRQPPAAES